MLSESLWLVLGVQPTEHHWLDRAIDAFTQLFPTGSFLALDFNVRALVALVLVSLTCGSVGSLVVGSRMAFFSDALAHCAFAGVSIGFVFFTMLVQPLWGADKDHFWEWVTPIMVIFGALVGYGIAAVRMRTSLSSDTVIGVFFAGAIGLAAILRKLMRDRSLFSLEDFLFGDPINISGEQLVGLAGLTLVTFLALAWLYNPLLLTGFSHSLALSRRVPVRWSSYVFVILLALIVNLCLRYIGALLINALLVVPAATAINCTRNLRQLFRWTLALSLLVSIGGQILSWDLENTFRSRGHNVSLGTPGMIILLSILLFIFSLFVGPWLRRRPAA